VPEGFAFAALPAATGAALAGLGAPGWGAACGVLALAVLAFFRNPGRPVPGDERTVVAPADGRVITVDPVEDGEGRKCPRVGIFLSLLDVHVNRAPVAGRVLAVERAGGAHRPAFDPGAEAENERTTLVLETARGERVRVVQMVGVLARRIVCHPRPGEWLERGTRYGLIRFGSRTDVVLPPGSRIAVGRGERVRGGSTVVARLVGAP
jgi:phosphatidylserine decarboxylase